MTWLKLSEREKTTLPIALLLLVIATILRVYPHEPNVTPFFAVSVLVGFILGRDRALLSGVLAALMMVVSDVALGTHESMPFVYAGIAMAALVGSYGSAFVPVRGAKGAKSWLGRIVGAFLISATASALFFVVSNVGVWLVGGLYPRTLAGLVECFVMAIPFFTKSLTADLTFGTLLLVVASRLVIGARAGQSESAKVVHG